MHAYQGLHIHPTEINPYAKVLLLLDKDTIYQTQVHKKTADPGEFNPFMLRHRNCA